MAEEFRTIVTLGGSVNLPDAVCERHGWVTGTLLVIRETAEGIHLVTDPHDEGTSTFIPITQRLREINPDAELPIIEPIRRK